ncbi:MAG: glycerol-3-phosphate 1-O-acyltransferase PlsY [Victivallaceae bacterium]|nr:glycerol-3-phosphate 1-O-acyltransferase PlsY [Victivallaceae bacterium]
MPIFAYYIIIFIVAYLLGSLPWGLWIGLAYGKDVRKAGSGNIGATNVTRVVGPIQGKVCFFLDFLKGLLPVAGVAFCIQRGWLPVLVFGPALALAAAVVGHMFPIFLKFKGGKGISTAAGGVAGLSPLAVIVAGAVWAAVFFRWRYVSLASILAAAVVPVAALAFSLTGIYHVSWPSLAVLVLLAALAIFRHKSNIARLRNGTESRFVK